MSKLSPATLRLLVAVSATQPLWNEVDEDPPEIGKDLLGTWYYIKWASVDDGDRSTIPSTGRFPSSSEAASHVLAAKNATVCWGEQAL